MAPLADWNFVGMVSGGIGFRLCHHLYMTQTYQWTKNQHEIAPDAIIVGIDGTSAEMLMAGLSYVEPSASIHWPAWMDADGQAVDAGKELGPWLVPDALKRAEELKAQFGFPRVVVTMKEQGIWRDEWGALAPMEGSD